jgi:hypothetical protein
MSWNAKRFHRVVEELKRKDQVSRDALCIWLTADAVDRLHASGGYIEDSATAFGVLDDLLNGKMLGLTPDGGHLTGGTAGPAGRMSVCRASGRSTPRSFGSRRLGW